MALRRLGELFALDVGGNNPMMDAEEIPGAEETEADERSNYNFFYCLFDLFLGFLQTHNDPSKCVVEAIIPHERQREKQCRVYFVTEELSLTK